jgi:hypothetical protein
LGYYGEVFADFEGGVETLSIDVACLDSMRVVFELDVSEELEEDVDSFGVEEF